MRVIADFTAEGEGELSVRTGEIVDITHGKNASWVLCLRKASGAEGYVPAAYLEDAHVRAMTDAAAAVGAAAAQMMNNAPRLKKAGSSSPIRRPLRKAGISSGRADAVLAAWRLRDELAHGVAVSGPGANLPDLEAVAEAEAEARRQDLREPDTADGALTPTRARTGSGAASWFFRDAAGVERGPFPAAMMRAWFEAGRFTRATRVRVSLAGSRFSPLAALFPDPARSFPHRVAGILVRRASSRSGGDGTPPDRRATSWRSRWSSRWTI